MWKKQRFRALKSQVWMALIVSEGKTLLDLYQRIKKWSTWALASLIQWCWNINWTLHLSPSLHQVHKISDGTVLSQWFRSYWKQPHPQTEHIPRRRWWLPPTYQCPLYRPPPHILSGASSALSASSSDPKRSMSSSSLASFGVARGVAGRTYRLLADGRRALSVWKEFMWLYQRQRWQSVGEGGEGMASNTIMSAWDATKPSM